MDWTWTPDDHPSDLATGGSLFDRRLLRYSEDVGTFGITVPVGSSAGYFYTQPNQPGNRNWRGGEAWSARVRVVAANPRVTLQLGLFRFDGLGNPVEAYSNPTAGQLLDQVDDYLFSGTTLAQGAAPFPDASHRMRLAFLFSRTSAPGGGALTLGYGDPTTDLLGVPILMANPRIIYNAVNLDFPCPPSVWRPRMRRRATLTMSDGAVAQTQHAIFFDDLFLRVLRVADQNFLQGLRAFWSWAGRGKQYAVALDSADTVDQTITGTANAGQAVIPMTNTTGIQAGRSYLVREAAGSEMEVVTVLSIIVNTSVTCTANLVYGYGAGDVFRSLDYYPKMVTLDDELGLTLEQVNYTFEHNASEDRG